MTAIRDFTLRQLIKRHEGSHKQNGRHYPYVDSVGKWTLGYGRNIEDNGISDVEADYLLTNDIATTLYELKGAFPFIRD